MWAGDELADSVMCVHPGSAPIRGRAEVLRSWALIMANTTYIQFFLTDVDINVVGDVAVVTCSENILTADSPEGDLAGGRVVATNVFRRTGAGWRLWLHHGSPVAVQEETGEEES